MSTIARKRSRPSRPSWISTNPPSCPASAPIRWWRKTAPIRATKGASTNPNIRRLRLMAGARARTCRSRPPRELARGLDRGQSRMAAAQRGGHAGGESALLRGRERQYRRRRQDARRWTYGLFEKRRRAGRPAHRDPDERPAARACGARSSMSTMCRRPARAKRASPTPGKPARPIPISTPRSPSSAFGRRSACPTLCRSAWITRPRSIPRPCRWSAGIRFMPRPWR